MSSAVVLGAPLDVFKKVNGFQLRILGTGSREFPVTSLDFVELVLLQEFSHVAGYVEFKDVIVVHGANGTYGPRTGKLIKGLDMVLDMAACKLGMTSEPHPADWPTCVADCPPGHRKKRFDGTEYCPTAGIRRNIEMVKLVADVCLAFPLGRSPGTRHCMKLAKAAGIHVIDCSLLTSAT